MNKSDTSKKNKQTAEKKQTASGQCDCSKSTSDNTVHAGRSGKDGSKENAGNTKSGKKKTS